MHDGILKAFGRVGHLVVFLTGRLLKSDKNHRKSLPTVCFLTSILSQQQLKHSVHWSLARLQSWHMSTVEPRLSGPPLSGLFDYPDFFSGPVFS